MEEKNGTEDQKKIITNIVQLIKISNCIKINKRLQINIMHTKEN